MSPVSSYRVIGTEGIWDAQSRVFFGPCDPWKVGRGSGSIVYDGGATQGNDEGRGKPERLGWVLYGSFEFTFDDYLAWSQLQVVTL